MTNNFGERENLINLFIDRNSKINLSAIKKPEDVYVKHILDSIELGSAFEFHRGASVIDIGTG